MSPHAYIDTAFSIHFGGRERAKELILAHHKQYVLFGPDSPWDSQQNAIGARGARFWRQRELTLERRGGCIVVEDLRDRC